MCQSTNQTTKEIENIMSNATEVKRGRGRPASFPNQETKPSGYSLPVATLKLVEDAAVAKEVNRNVIVDRALRAYLRTRSKV